MIKKSVDPFCVTASAEVVAVDEKSRRNTVSTRSLFDLCCLFGSLF